MKARKVLIIVIIVLLLIVGGFALVYFKTDLFKNNKQRFWKYASTNGEVVEIFNSEDLQSIKNKKNNSPFEINSCLSVNYKNTAYTISANTSAKNTNNLQTEVSFQCKDKNIVNFNIVKKSNLIGLKWDELANGYITIKNNNIKDLAKDFGIEDVSNIPDTINWSSLLDILYVSENDEKYFSKTYSELISNNTNKNNYSKEETGIKIGDKNHTATAYKLKLNENEAKEVSKKVLNNIAKEDSRALNFISSKLKLLNFPSKYTQVEAISNAISEFSDYIDKVETTDDDFIEITVYVENKRVIQTSIKFKDGKIIKIIFDKDNNRMSIKKEVPMNSENNTSNKLLDVAMDFKELNISNEISEDKNSSITKFNAKFGNNIVIEYSSKTSIVKDIQDNTNFENSGKIVLNELEPSQLKNLGQQIIKNIPSILEEKAELLKERYDDYEEIQSVER